MVSVMTIYLGANIFAFLSQGLRNAGSLRGVQSRIGAPGAHGPGRRHRIHFRANVCVGLCVGLTAF